jgi:WD40 repeat protein
MGPYEISAIAWNPVHDAIAIACSDGLIRILDADTLEISQALEGHTDEVNTVTWSPDGTRLASGSMDKTIRIWDIPQAE